MRDRASCLFGCRRRLRFSPLSYSPQLWLDAVIGSRNSGGSPASYGDPIGRVQDRSGNGNDAVQATTAAMPTLAGNIQNGLPGLSFDGTDDKLVASVSVGAVGTDFLVAKLAAVTGQRYFMDGDVDNSRVFATGSGAGFEMYPPDHVFGALDTAAHVFRMVYNGASSQFALDRSASSITSSVAAVTKLTFGSPAVTGNDFLYGFLFEYLHYNSVLTAGQIAAVESYLKGKWGTP